MLTSWNYSKSINYITCHLRRVRLPMSSRTYEGCLSCGFLSLGTWSLHSSLNKHVSRPKLENFVALLKPVPHPFTSRLALKWFQLLYVIILSILEGGKKGQEYGIMLNEARKSLFRLRRCLS